MHPQLYYTVSSKELRADIPASSVLLSAASFCRANSRGHYYLCTPRHLSSVAAAPVKGADCGAFTATLKWGGHYRFTPAQYLRWLYVWLPQWAAILDLCCLSATRGDPGAALVAERQAWTTRMAWQFWQCYRDVPWCWVSTIQGYSLDQFEQHARDLLPLIRQMHDYYADTGWWNDDQPDTQYGNSFRVGLGSLCGRPLTFILEVIARVQAIIGRDIPLHLWGVKLKELQSGSALPGVISCDTGAWSGLFGREHKLRQASGFSVREYSWQVSYPRYAGNVKHAQQKPVQASLFIEFTHRDKMSNSTLIPFSHPNDFID
ncbi:hypothetical protein [Dictyobacter formicarum]|uniref:Heparin-sulfate lyase N-terminal domain-containing protein n=1 Tax=Dictyobacter formicarum TaxID=2778368 RepID=A0ABQ3VQ21_9CHLR|nr:hypothetical protein [Dictyobacter formicarum]GHO88210.1 hypothetical protein KSZ_62160 [Dictyobacter formicarum]